MAADLRGILLAPRMVAVAATATCNISPTCPWSVEFQYGDPEARGQGKNLAEHRARNAAHRHADRHEAGLIP